MSPITIETKLARVVTNELDVRIVKFNEQHRGPRNIQPLVLSVRDDGGSLIAGLCGESFWNVLHVDILWVDEPYRGKDYGSALLRRAEEVAQERLCEFIYLDTFDFQAPDFYLKQGYTIMGELRGVPRGSARKWFCKSLSKAPTLT